MSVFRSIVFTAALAGLIVGVSVTAVQQFGTIPLIAKAEVYEQRAEAAQPAAPAQAVARAQPAQGHSHAAAGAHEHPATGGHDHSATAWSPADGLERNAYTALFNVLEWIGFGMCIAGGLVLSRRRATWREGLLWGLGGFAAFVLAPGLGLPPELPGMPAAELVPRQIWWVGTAAATAAGLAMIAFRPSLMWCIAGVGLIALPHLIGAPQPPGVETNVPEAMSRQFVVAVTLTTFLSWALLGALSGYLLTKFAPEASER